MGVEVVAGVLANTRGGRTTWVSRRLCLGSWPGR